MASEEKIARGLIISEGERSSSRDEPWVVITKEGGSPYYLLYTNTVCTVSASPIIV